MLRSIPVRRLFSVLLIHVFMVQPFQPLLQPLHAGQPAAPLARTGVFAGLSADLAAQESWNIVLTPVNTEFHDHTGLDHHQPSRKLILSANAPAGDPNSFELIAGDGGHSGFSNVAGLQGEVLVAVARDDGQGLSRGGFQPGTLFASTGAPGVVARISSDGATVQNPWVSLPDEAEVTGLHIDRRGVFGGDLIVVTAAGGVWRVSSSATPTQVAALGTRLAGVAVVPDDPERYGPWAGKILAGAKEEGSVYAVDAQGQSEPLQVGLDPQDIDIVPAHENFYAIDHASRKLLGAAEGAFTGIIGDVLITQESPGLVSRVRWDGTAFVVTGLAEAPGLKQVAFSPAGAGQIPAVKQVYETIAVVRHAPRLNSGRVEGTLWQLTGENTLFDGTDTITSDLLVPGTPAVTATAPASYGGTVEGSESSEPSGYTVTLQGSASLRHVVTRTDPIELRDVDVPPAPEGTRDVQLSRAGETIGDPATLRDLEITGKAGSVAVPPGTYGSFTAGGRNELVFGVEGSTVPAVYNLEELTLTGGSQLRLAGPVKLRVRNAVTLAGSTVGAADDPKRLVLEVADGLPGAEAVKVSGNGVLYAIVRAPQGKILIEGNGRLRGTVACDILQVDGNGVLQITENDIPPPPVNRPPTVNAGPDHTITLPTDTVALEGTASDDGLPAGSTLGVTWTKVSGPGSVTFGDAESAATSATFSADGEYVLKLTASDGQLSSSETITVTVIPRNQPPVVDAGQEQTVELGTPAALRGTVTDDALPRGSVVTVTWSMVSGPGPVTFADPNAAVTTASFSVAGVYTLRLSASDTEFTVSDDVAVTVLVTNEAPSVSAGPDRELTLPSTVTLNGTASDDGRPSGSTLEVFWSTVSGPAPVIFRDAFAAATVATFTAPGAYVLRLTASDSELNATDEVTIVVNPQPYTSRTYTLDADFNEGSLVNVTQSVPHQLELDDTAQTLNFIWVAVSSKGTVVKINTETGAVLGEYFTSPSGQPKDPSRTTVDNNGNVWAGNRGGNSVVHIGLVENGQCVDRNNNGVIETSTGYGDIKPWPNTNGANTNGGVTLAQDECILHYTRTTAFIVRHVSVTKDNDVWVSGWGSTNHGRFDLIDGTTGLIKRSEPAVGFGGYGGLVDKSGVLWSARGLLRWDTSKPLTGPNGGNWKGYNHNSYGLCIDSKGNVWNTSLEGNQIYKFAPDGTHLGTFSHGAFRAQGCVVDKNDDVWVAQSLFDRTVAHLKNNGVFVGRVSVGDGPTGVAVDAKGKIWATNHNSGTVARIDPNLGPIGADGVTRVGQVDLTTQYLGGNLYNYSDMTGSTLLGAPGAGTWSTVFDTRLVGAAWGRIGWTAQVCGDGQLTVSVASSEDGTTFGPAATVTNGADLTVANGRYLKVTVSFKRASSGESPVLYDLSVGTSGYELPAAPNTAPTAFAGADLTMTLPDAARLNGSACDDGFPRGTTLALSWSQVSGPGTATFTNSSSTTPNVTFTLPGDYVLRLTASDGEHSASDEVSVKALPANMAPIVNAGPDQTVTLPNTATLNGTVSDDGLPAGGTVSTFWSQLSGPGTVTFNNPGSPVTGAAFPVAGTYTLRLTGNDSHRVGTDDVVITVNPSPALNGATLALVAGNAGPYVTGTMQPLRATLRNSAGNPLANYGVEFTVSGPNATAGSAVTDASGVATFSYSGTNLGTDTVSALVRHTATATINSPAVAMTWTLTAVPAVQGWIGTPLNGSTATGIVPITVGAGVTLTQGTVEYLPATNPSAVTVLAANAQGGPGATLAALDTTLLANGNYVIRLRGIDSNGQELVSEVTITVAGENKPGRVTFSVTDLTVPVTGIPITISRRYDSLERNQVGDFGYGWSLEMAGPRLEVSPDHDVTITEPGGRRVTFQFAPMSFGFPFHFLYQPAYTPEPGVYGKLASDGCGMLIRSGGGVACYLSSDPTYRPTVYTYTDPYGRVYTMTAAGKLVSIKNLDGNVLTFGPSGITSSAGDLTVPIVRDSQGRITEITDPTGEVYSYTYDAAGDLVSVELPDTGTPLSYEYAPGHFFLKGTDARGNAEATTTYYADGRLQSVTDAMGKTTGYTYDLATNTTIITHPDNTGTTIQKYDANGMLLSTTDPLGRTTSYTYDANRNKRTETDALGKTTTYDYDAKGHLRSVTDPLNKTRLFTNNEFGQPVTATDQLGKTRTLKYDANHNLSGVSDELGTQMALTWNDRGNPLTFADANGKVTHFTYDAYGNILSKTDPLGRTTSYTYDTMGRVLTMTDPRGVSRFAYDAMGRMLSVIDPLSNTTRYEYDGNGNRTAVIDAKGLTTGYEYDAANRVSKITYPDGTTHSYTYNFRGQKETETVAGLEVSRTTTYSYDNAGQLAKITHPDGSEINLAYDEVGRVKTVTDERNKTVTYEYDPGCGCRDRLAKITDANGNSTTYTYDAAGRRISFTDAANRETRYTYDVRGRLTKTTFADNTFAETTYDGMGRPVTSTDQEGRVTRSAYDEVGNLLSITAANGATTQYTYGALKNLLSSTDANGRATRFEYDALNRLIKRVLPLGMADLYTYDQVGNLATRTDFRGKQTSYEYDSLNRLTAQKPDASLGEPAVLYSYTATGMRRSMTDASGTTTYTYDQRDRLLTKQTPQGTLTYTYDLAGGLTSMRSSNADGVSVDYTYDDLNRLESVIDNRLVAGTTTYTYDAVGNLKSDSRPNGVRADYTYNALNRLTDLGVTRGGTTQASYAYTLDRTGRRLSVTEGSGRTVNYTYDAVYRLTREAISNSASNGVVDYTYDLVGNRLSRISSLEGVLSTTSAYDANDRLLSDAYDANGNTRSADGRTFVYDFENRIKSANNGAVRITYDGDGNLAAKTVGGVTTRYLVDDLNPTGYSQVVEEIVDGQVQTQYTYGHMIVSQKRRLAGGWSVSFYSTDGHGSVRQLTDEAGAVTDTYTFDAFGKLISRTGTTPNPYLYAGERFDFHLGLYHLRARHYDADRGRFVSMDPYPGAIGDPVSLHKYLYANADPVNFIDPSGLASLGDYGRLVGSIALRIVPSLVRVGLGIACVLITNGSTIASVLGYDEWVPWAQLAEVLFLIPCLRYPLRLRGGPDLPSPRAGGGPDLPSPRAGGPGGGGPGSGGPGSGGPGGPAASTPVGRRHSPGASGPDAPQPSGAGRHNPQHTNPPYQQRPPQNEPGSVHGREYSGHAFDQMRNRGLVPSVVENTIQTGQRLPGATPGTTVYHDPINNVRVLVNQAGRVITVE